MKTDEKEKSMKAVIYCRVSTKEQVRDGMSLQNQERACRDFAKDRNFIIDKIFIEEGESAKTQLRPKLLNLLTYCCRKESKIDALVVWKVDRFSRETADHFALKARLAAYGIRLYSVTEPIDNTPIGELTETVLAGFAKFDNDVRSERSSIGMRDKVNDGYWVWKAPIGYINGIDNNGEKNILIDKERATLINKIFTEFSRRVNTQKDICKKINTLGLRTNNGKRISTQLLNRILNGSVYAGLIKNPWTGIIVEGNYEPIISKSLFYKCQAILKGEKESLVPRQRNNPKFPLRGMVKCGHCGTILTASSSKGRRKHYDYYHCYKCKGQKSIPSAEIEKCFLRLLRKLTPRAGYIRLFKEIVLDQYKKRYKELIDERTVIKRAKNGLEEKRIKIIDKFNEDKISEKDYRAYIDNLENEIMVKTIALNENTIDKYDVEGLLDYAEKFILDAPKIWLNGDLNQKQRFQAFIFPQGIAYKDNEFIGTPVLSPVYAILTASKTHKSTLVTLGGVEPPLPP